MCVCVCKGGMGVCGDQKRVSGTSEARVTGGCEVPDKVLGIELSPLRE